MTLPVYGKSQYPSKLIAFSIQEVLLDYVLILACQGECAHASLLLTRVVNRAGAAGSDRAEAYSARGQRYNKFDVVGIGQVYQCRSRGEQMIASACYQGYGQ